MIIKFKNKNNLKNKYLFVEPDEIFLDAKNIQNFDQQQFEGRLEKPLSKNNPLILGIFFVLFSFLFLGKLGILQIKKGEAYFTRSENNTLEKIIIFAERGIIYDKNGVELAWNKKIEQQEDTKENPKNDSFLFPVREYKTPGFAHLLGYVSSPSQDSKGNFWQTEYVGKAGIEKQYNDKITGKNGERLIETDVFGNIYSENIINPPKRGEALYTTIDSRIQEKLFKSIKEHAEKYNYTGGAGVIMNIQSGEILAITNYPEYDSTIVSLGKDEEIIKNYLSDKRTVFLDRAVSGLYTPGSIVKPFLALAALTENIISPEKEIISTGSIVIPNPYTPSQPSIFKDWKAHGWTAMREAIAVSSDVYFYTIGGGHDGQKGLGISNIEKYARMFGIGTKTGIDLPNEKEGVIPNPEWKAKNFKNDPWRLGNTYHTSIGQYGFQVTPLEMTRATAMLANFGKSVRPKVIPNKNYIFDDTLLEADIKKEYFDIVHEGMREVVTYGTATVLNVPYVKVAGKTGTAQVGISKSRINSWIIGFFPYENPKYAFTVMMESAPSVGYVGAPLVMRNLLDYMKEEAPEYFE